MNQYEHEKRIVCVGAANSNPSFESRRFPIGRCHAQPCTPLALVTENSVTTTVTVGNATHNAHSLSPKKNPQTHTLCEEEEEEEAATRSQCNGIVILPCRRCRTGALEVTAISFCCREKENPKTAKIWRFRFGSLA